MTAYAGSGYAFDLQNRISQANPAGGGSVMYGYDSTNHRVYKGAYNSGTYSAEEIYFYGAEGNKYGTWQINPSSGILLQASVTKQWFGSRLLSPQDWLDSRGKYFPFGQERTNVTPPNPPNDQEKFESYTRDSATGLDYANQRFYNNPIGRFMQPDPLGGSADAAVPQSWNRYAYVGDDPANSTDPTGQLLEEEAFVQDVGGYYSDGSGGGGGDYGYTVYPNGGIYTGPVYTPSGGTPTFTADVCAYCNSSPIVQALVEVNSAAQQFANFLNSVTNNPVFNGAAMIGGVFAGGGGLAADVSETPIALLPSGGVTVNLGGVGEVAGNVINYQPGVLFGSSDLAFSNAVQIASESGQSVVLGEGGALPFATGSVNTVIVNNVPIGTFQTMGGAALDPAEIFRILAQGGTVTGSSASGLSTLIP